MNLNNKELACDEASDFFLYIFFLQNSNDIQNQESEHRMKNKALKKNGGTSVMAYSHGEESRLPENSFPQWGRERGGLVTQGWGWG